ncbi:MAG: VOC family protein [Acidobacteriota bacterium]
MSVRTSKGNVKHLDHLNLTVENLDETIDWYRRVFGFELVERAVRDGEPWGVLRSGEAMLCVYENPGRHVTERTERGRLCIHAVSHFALRITDREAWEETVQREELETFYDSPVDYPHSRSWYVYDPSGYEIEVASWNDDVVRFEELTAVP